MNFISTFKYQVKGTKIFQKYHTKIRNFNKTNQEEAMACHFILIHNFSLMFGKFSRKLLSMLFQYENNILPDVLKINKILFTIKYTRNETVYKYLIIYSFMLILELQLKNFH